MTYDIKITIIGETEVGKTSLAQYFITEQVQLQNATTPCASFLKKMVKFQNLTLNFQLWDTAGQERFRSIAPMYYRGSDCVLLVYDVSNHESFVQIQQFWLKEVQQKCQQNAIVAIVANKQDLEQKQVEKQQAQQFADSFSLQLFETSSKTGLNIVNMFNKIGEQVVQQKIQQKQINEQQSQNIQQEKPYIHNIDEQLINQNKQKCCM